MFKHILLPTDGSELSEKAARAAVDFAAATGAHITAYMSIPDYPFMPLSDSSHETRASYQARMEADARGDLARIEAAAAAANVMCTSVTSTSNAPHRGIIAKATELGCDVIFMASHGRSGLNSLLIGSETQKVLAHTNIPVLVFR